MYAKTGRRGSRGASVPGGLVLDRLPNPQRERPAAEARAVAFAANIGKTTPRLRCNAAKTTPPTTNTRGILHVRPCTDSMAQNIQSITRVRKFKQPHSRYEGANSRK